MSRLSSNLLSAALIGAGALAWTLNSRTLAQESSMLIPSNPMGVKMSPYGEVIAMAMQGPIELYWHAGAGHDHQHEEHSPICEDSKCGDHQSCESEGLGKPPATSSGSFRGLLNELNAVAGIRTNPKASTEKHLFHMRRQIEDKLRFAYTLDPSNFGNYNSYHLFLTEPQLGTRIGKGPELTREAATLAEATIDYCLRRTDDPRPALTAAAAAENELALMFEHPESFTTTQMKERLAIIDLSLARHQEIARHWLGNGNWALLSPMRQEEIADRYRFLSRVRDAAEGTILRLEGKPSLGQASN